MKRRAIVLVVCLSVAAISICGCASLPDEARMLDRAKTTRERAENDVTRAENVCKLPELKLQYAYKRALSNEQCTFNESKDKKELDQLNAKLDVAKTNYESALAASKTPPAAADSKAPDLAKLESDLEQAEENCQTKLTEIHQHSVAAFKDQSELEKLDKEIKEATEEQRNLADIVELKYKLEEAEEKEQRVLRSIYRGISKDLDKVEKSVSKWGKVGISEFALLPNKSQFELNYSMDAAAYVAAARQGVSASASSSEVETFKAALGLQGTLQPPVVSAGGVSDKATNAATSSAGSTGGSAGKSKAGDTSTEPASTNAAASSSGSTGGNGTQAGGKSASAPSSNNLVVSERTAMMTGLNDKLAELVLNQLANPIDDENSEVLFAVFQVTCQPGSANWKEYVADINVALEYARSVPDPVSGEPDFSRTWGRNASFKSPMVLAVVPLMNSQSMDLSATRDSQSELALTLAAAYAAQPGMQAQANLLMDYVKQRDTEMKSRTAVPTVTTYTDGSNFGFQIYPGFQPMEDPASERARSANVLQPICFPAVVALRIDKSDFDLENPWDTVVTHVHTRWIPTGTNWYVEHEWITNYFIMNKYWLFPFLGYITINLPPSASDRVEIQNCLDDASERMAILKPHYSYTGPYRDFERAIPPLISATRGMTRMSTLPAPEFIKESAKQQSDQDVSKTAKLIIQGGLSSDGQNTAAAAGQKDGESDTLFGFVNAPTVISVESNKPQFQLKGNKPAVEAVTLDGYPCTFTVLSKNALTVTVPAGSFDDRKAPDLAKVCHRLTLTIATAGQASNLTTTSSAAASQQANSLARNVNIQFINTIKEPVSYPSEFGYKPTVTVTRDSLGKVTGIIVNGGRNSAENEELLQTVEKILLASEALAPAAATAAADKVNQQGNTVGTSPQPKPAESNQPQNPGVANPLGGSTVTIERDDHGKLKGIVIDADASSSNLQDAQKILQAVIDEKNNATPASGSGGSSGAPVNNTIPPRATGSAPAITSGHK
jgi:hypothetical protein